MGFKVWSKDLFAGDVMKTDYKVTGMPIHSKPGNRKNPQAGMTFIELLLAGSILMVMSLGFAGLIVGSIATNNRNKVNSTQTMLAESIVEHVSSTLIGTGDSTITDCAGNNFTIETVAGGADLTAAGNEIDFSEDIAADPAKADYHMDYYVNAPCTSSGTLQGVYDVRWNVQLVGGVSDPTNTYLLTVSARLKNEADGGLLFPRPVTLRLMSGS
jgi:Tfp pilus assembly protein PilV